MMSKHVAVPLSTLLYLENDSNNPQDEVEQRGGPDGLSAFSSMCRYREYLDSPPGDHMVAHGVPPQLLSCMHAV